MSTGVELLLVEDDPVTGEVLGIMLADDGWRVGSADCGESALDYLQSATSLPQVVLCDQKLPGLHGPELAQKVRSFYDKAKAPAPVLLAMSASRSAVPGGYHALLLKPFSAADVRTAVEKRRADGSSAERTDSPLEDATETGSLPVLDADVVRKLQTSMGAARLRELYAFALTDAGERILRMKAALASGDTATLAGEAHMLKGAAGMVGASRLAVLAQYFEQQTLAHSETTGVSTGKMAMLCAALDDIERMLETQFPAQS